MKTVVLTVIAVVLAAAAAGAAVIYSGAYNVVYADAIGPITCSVQEGRLCRLVRATRALNICPLSI